MKKKLSDIKPSQLKKAFAVALLGAVTVTGGYMYSTSDAGPLSDTAKATPVAQKSEHINIKDFKFSPDNLTVHAGTKIEWTNRDDAPHNAIENNKVFESPMLGLNGQHSETLTKPGNYSYICSVHPFMIGTIKVVP